MDKTLRQKFTPDDADVMHGAKTTIEERDTVIQVLSSQIAEQGKTIHALRAALIRIVYGGDRTDRDVAIGLLRVTSPVDGEDHGSFEREDRAGGSESQPAVYRHGADPRFYRGRR